MDVLAVVLALEEPRHVVDAGDPVVQFLPRDIDVFGDRLGGVGHAMTESDRLDLGRLRHRPADDRHRVGVVQQERVRTYVLHVAGDLEHRRDRSQSPEDAARAQRIADRLLDAVSLGDPDLVLERLAASDVDHVEDVVRALERLPTVGRRLISAATPSFSTIACAASVVLRGAPRRCPSAGSCCRRVRETRGRPRSAFGRRPSYPLR